jgi:Rrf2 family protein
MRISARTDYAIRAVAHIAEQMAANGEGHPVKADDIARAQDIPPKYLLDILRDLRAAHLLRSQRGADGGYLLARPADQMTLGDVIRALEGPLATVHDLSVSQMSYKGAAVELPTVWKAMRTALRSVFDEISVADLSTGALPERIVRMATEYDGDTRLR